MKTENVLWYLGKVQTTVQLSDIIWKYEMYFDTTLKKCRQKSNHGKFYFILCFIWERNYIGHTKIWSNIWPNLTELENISFWSFLHFIKVHFEIKIWQKYYLIYNRNFSCYFFNLQKKEWELSSMKIFWSTQ